VEHKAFINNMRCNKITIKLFLSGVLPLGKANCCCLLLFILHTAGLHEERKAYCTELGLKWALEDVNEKLRRMCFSNFERSNRSLLGICQRTLQSHPERTYTYAK